MIDLIGTIPGCAYYSALSLMCRVGNPNRFPKGKSLAHYLGLTPGVNDSGEGTGRRGRITKAGGTMARWVLAQINRSTTSGVKLSLPTQLKKNCTTTTSFT